MTEAPDDTTETEIDWQAAKATAEVWRERPDLYYELEVMDRDPNHPFRLSELELEYEPCWLHTITEDRCQAGRRTGLRAEHEHVTLREMGILKEAAEMFDAMLEQIGEQDEGHVSDE